MCQLVNNVVCNFQDNWQLVPKIQDDTRRWTVLNCTILRVWWGYFVSTHSAISIAMEQCTVLWVLSEFLDPIFSKKMGSQSLWIRLDTYVWFKSSWNQNWEDEKIRLKDVWFQHDGATSHTVHDSMEILQWMFRRRIISRFDDVPWLPRSSDLSVCDFFLWRYLKSRAYSHKPQDLD